MFGILVNYKLFPAKILIVKYLNKRKKKKETLRWGKKPFKCLKHTVLNPYHTNFFSFVFKISQMSQWAERRNQN